MAKQNTRTIYSMLGLVIWGDIADLTLYRAHDGRFVIFSKTWPDKPPSPLQITQRKRLAVAAYDWKRLSGDHRDQWNAAARRASLAMTGYNLFVHFSLTPDPTCKATLERQTRTTLHLLPP